MLKQVTLVGVVAALTWSAPAGVTTCWKKEASCTSGPLSTEWCSGDVTVCDQCATVVSSGLAGVGEPDIIPRYCTTYEAEDVIKYSCALGVPGSYMQVCLRDGYCCAIHQAADPLSGPTHNGDCFEPHLSRTRCP